MKNSTLLAITLGFFLTGTAFPTFSAPFAYITNCGGANVSVIDTATNKTVATIPTQGCPMSVAIKSDGSRVYVGNYNSASVTVIDAQSNSVIKHITVGNYPAEIAIKPDGTRLYVPNYNSGTISVIDTATNTVINTISLGGNPWGATVNPSGTRAYISKADSNQVYVLDTATNEFVGAPISVGSRPTGMKVNPAGTRLYIVNENSNNMTVVNTATNAVVATVPVGAYPLQLAIKLDSSRVYVANRNSNTITVVDAASNAVVGEMPTGSYPVGVDSNPTGSRLYASNYNSNTVSVFNTANNTLIANIPVGSGPHTLGHFIGPAPAPATTTRLSISSSGSQGLGDSSQSAISADGRYLAFVSDAPNLVGGDSNARSDVFVRDRITKQTRRISVGSAGVQANGASYNPVISADGRYVAFASEATNLVTGDSNGATDVFVRDLIAGVTTRVSVDSASPAVQANGDSYEPAINADGSKIAFTSEASNLVVSDSNGVADVFVRDRTANTTSRISIATGVSGVQSNNVSGQAYLSGSGNIVAFISQATNLVAGDTNNTFDVFVRDLTANTTSRVSVAGASTQVNKDSWQPAMSSDGRYVVFASDATNLVTADSNGMTDIFVRDRTTNTTKRVSLDVSSGQSDGFSYNPVISNDGRYVAFDSLGTLDPVDYNNTWDVYLRDLSKNSTTRLSIATNTAEGNFDSQRPVMSADGRYILFDSIASNLVNGDTNSAADIFVRDRGVGTTPTYSTLDSTNNRN